MSNVYINDFFSAFSHPRRARPGLRPHRSESLITWTNPCVFLGISAPDSAPDSSKNNVRGPLEGRVTPKIVKKKSGLASEVAAGMFLRFKRSIRLKIQSNPHGNATGCHSPTTESVYVPCTALNFCKYTIGLVCNSCWQQSSTTCPKLV